MWLQDNQGARRFQARGLSPLCRVVFSALIIAMALSATIAPFSASQAGAQEGSDTGFPPLPETDPESFAAFLIATGGAPADFAAPVAAPVEAVPVAPVAAPAEPAPAEPVVAEVAAPVEAAPVYGAGQGIVGFALQFVGYPYVWAGNTPAGFDCSGFTQYVILNTLGIDIGHGTPGQTGFGYSVGYGAWAPGDLIFFANTFDVGISHVGIYIGDGMMVHAGSEETGVFISNVYSDYYTSHYYGAFRLA